ncbi:MAG: alpha/beta hydrolase [Candidatus Electrothrix sp. LOE1_4_5]|nr:alpha/beta hydrolase [Candidatus Electrothrix sp. AX1]MCI5117585.1 alpha/beta hydrolase [Candidatus Electrothrix gigas]MCI5181963.1 alpha/beta hydrolase [Candidatus Electrothrix gigas]MCI5190359.1 alpha/beta hydrolase [Candidatus Electrothrix gigas]
MNSIITALLAGALVKVGGQAVQDAYAKLKALLQLKFGANSELAEAVQQLEQDPDSAWRTAVVTEELAKVGADKDEEIIKAAEALVQSLEKGGQVSGKYQVDARKAKIGVLGDHATIKGGIRIDGNVFIHSDRGDKNIAQGDGAIGKRFRISKDYFTIHEPVVYPVWFGTNREPNDKEDLSKGFSGNRTKELGAVYYGRCDVAIPKTHRFGETGRAWWKRWVSLDFKGNDHLTIEKIECCKDSDDFWHQLKSRFWEREITERDAVVFLHGFNNSFEDAAIRAAQIGFDLKIRGYTAFFSWPSKAKVFKYTVDESSISASEDVITDFLLDFTKKSGAERVHIIAHSMGNRGLLQALKNIAGKVQFSDSPVEFGQIILAAPDLDVEVFRRAKDAYLSLSKSITIYSSSKDIPVFLSKRLHEYPRLGIIPPITIEEGIDTVKVNNFNLFNLGHGYFAEAEALLHDIYDLIRHGESPKYRQRLSEQQTEDGKIFWLLDT